MTAVAKAIDLYRCSECRRSDVRLYRSYGTFLRTEDLRCNKHVPDDDDLSLKDLEILPRFSKKSGWWVPLVDDGEGTVWGYTSCPDGDIARWHDKPDAAPSPEWRDGQWHDAPALMVPEKAWRAYYTARRQSHGNPWLHELVALDPHDKAGAHAVAVEQRKLVMAWVRRQLRQVPTRTLGRLAYATEEPGETGDRTAACEAVRQFLLAQLGPEET
jgi:hypothetical protein